MSGSAKKVSLADIYVQSLQKDNAFLKEKVSSLQKDIDTLNVKYEEERKKQQQEKIALQDDLSKMVRDISSLRNENTSLKEEINEYDANYVPATGSQRMKDALAETRQTLRETVEKYNEMVDSYDATREKCSSACIEADALRNDNETMKGELNKVHLLYQAAAKELEQNRNDMGDMMKEMAALRQALEQKESSEVRVPVSRSPVQDVNAKLVVSLRRQIGDLTSSLEQLTRENSSLKTRVNSQSSSSSSQLNEWRKRATQAEEKVKALSASLVEITNDRDRLLAEQQDAVGGAAGDAGEWKQKSDELEKRVIELTQRNRNYERSVGSMVTRCDAAEKKAKELAASLQAATQAAAQEKAALQAQLEKAQRERASALAEKSRATATPRATGSVGELRKKDEEIEKLRASVMQLEGELQEQQQLVERLKSESASSPAQPSREYTSQPSREYASQPSHEPSHELLHEPSQSSQQPSQEQQTPTEYHEQTAVVEAESADDAIMGVLQQMIAAPELYSLDTIDDISFPDCGFNDEHMQQFTVFLQQNEFPSLVTIDVSHNLLTERSVIPFIKVLLGKRASSLQKLDLSYNQLDDHFADALLDVLIHATSNSSIRCIEFEGNLFSDGVLQQMKQICGGSM
ncbi:hypothetical protein WA577_007123 [Blastocystis sp. JDR]